MDNEAVNARHKAERADFRDERAAAAIDRQMRFEQAKSVRHTAMTEFQSERRIRQTSEREWAAKAREMAQRHAEELADPSVHR